MGEFDFGKTAVLMAADMTMRDEFAARALVECIKVAEHQTPGRDPKLSLLFEKAATYAYFAADAMLKARQS